MQSTPIEHGGSKVRATLRYVLILGGVAIHVWTVWIAWTAKGAFAALFTLTVPFLGEIVWAVWLSLREGTPLHPYVQVLTGYLALAVAHRAWRRWAYRGRDASDSGQPAANPDNGSG
jgi:hypothetical protein